MEKHADKGRLLIAQSMLESENIGVQGISIAIDCIISYDDSITPKLEKIINRCKNKKDYESNLRITRWK